MIIIEIFLLALSLALDCFAISISQGIKQTANKKSILTLATLFGLFQGGMLVIGYYAGFYLLNLISSFANFVAFGLLLYIGVKMIKEGFEIADEEIEVTNIKQYIVLSIATSIDALAAGVSLNSLNYALLSTSLAVGIVSLVMALIGGFSGKQIGEKFGKRSEVFGGLVLIGLGLKALF